MPAAIILVLLLAGILALVPVWRLRVAGWPQSWLFVSWVTYAVLILVVMRFVAVTRYALPVLIVLYVAPFVAGPERLAKVLGRQRVEPPRTVIDVTPKPPPAIPAARPKKGPGRTLHADPPGGQASGAPLSGDVLEPEPIADPASQPERSDAT